MEMLIVWTKNLSVIFQRVLANILRRNGLTEFCTNYIDDILVFSETFDQRIKHKEQL